MDRSKDAVQATNVFQFENNGSWVENIVTRRNGQLLITRLDVPELWTVNPTQGSGSLLYTFPNVTSLAGIAEVYPDVFAVAGFKIGSNPPATFPGSGLIFTVDLRNETPAFKTVGGISQSVIPNGIATFGAQKGVILVAESGLGLIHKFDIDTGATSVVSNDATLQAGPGGSTGVNGIKVHGNHVYFTSSTKQLFGRIPLTKDAAPAGPVEIIAETSTFLDDFVLAEDGTAYVATNSNNTVLKITNDGKTETVVGALTSLEVAGATSLAWSCDGKEAYVATCGGQRVKVNGTLVEPGKVVKIALER